MLIENETLSSYVNELADKTKLNKNKNKSVKINDSIEHGL